MAIDPRIPNTIYAALVASTGFGVPNGIYKSTDGGKKWDLLLNGPTGNTVGRITLALYDQLNLDRTTTNELFVSVSNTNGNLLQMLKSIDGGANFLDLTAKVLHVGNYLGTQGQYDTTLAIDPLDPSFIYASGDQQYDSHGTSLAQVTSRASTAGTPGRLSRRLAPQNRQASRTPTPMPSPSTPVVTLSRGTTAAFSA